MLKSPDLKIADKTHGSNRVVVTLHSTKENLQRVAKMEENPKRLMEEAQTKQEEMRTRNIEKQDVAMCLKEEVGKKRSREKGEAGQVSFKGEDDGDRVNETCRKGKGKGTEVKENTEAKEKMETVRRMRSAEHEKHQERRSEDDKKQQDKEQPERRSEEDEKQKDEKQPEWRSEEHERQQERRSEEDEKQQHMRKTRSSPPPLLQARTRVSCRRTR